jgi:hypothetical protein
MQHLAEEIERTALEDLHNLADPQIKSNLGTEGQLQGRLCSF